jgi:hypothetical protein
MMSLLLLLKKYGDNEAIHVQPFSKNIFLVSAIKSPRGGGACIVVKRYWD